MRKAILILFLFGSFAEAKDLTHRLGIGYSSATSLDLPSVAAKYHVSPTIALGTSLGVDTLKNESRFALSLRLYRTIFVEEHLNFYGGAGVSSIQHELDGNNNSGFELAGFFGVEFFLPGLDSLGVSFDAGIGVASDTTGTRFRTIADHPLKAGMIFYF
jgi:hypothetical protein